MYGSRHLTYDIPFPMDECNIDEIEIRRRPSRRHPNQSLFSRMSHKKPSPMRTNSLNVRDEHKPDRMPVTRNISSPSTMQHPSADNQLRYNAAALQMICYHTTSNYLSKIIDFVFSFLLNKQTKKLQEKKSNSNCSFDKQ